MRARVRAALVRPNVACSYCRCIVNCKKNPSNPGDIWSVSPHACRANNGRIKTWRYIKKTTTKKHAKPMLQHTMWWHKWPIATEQSVRPFVWQFLINSKTHKPKLNQSYFWGVSSVIFNSSGASSPPPSAKVKPRTGAVRDRHRERAHRSTFYKSRSPRAQCVQCRALNYQCSVMYPCSLLFKSLF